MKQTTLSLEAADQTWRVPLPQSALWRMLLSGQRARIAEAVKQINELGKADEYAALLLLVRRRGARRTWRLIGRAPVGLPYGERARRSAQTALSLLWGALGREVATALDPKVSHFERAGAHKALARRRDHRAVAPLIDALLNEPALENWLLIGTLGALGDARAVEALTGYMGLNPAPGGEQSALADRLDVGIEVGRALRTLNGRAALRLAQTTLTEGQPLPRAAAALIIGGWGDEKYHAPLVPLLEQAQPAVRKAAVIALGELKALPALGRLQSCLDDPDPEIRTAAERSVQQVKAAHPAPVRGIRRPQAVSRVSN